MAAHTRHGRRWLCLMMALAVLCAVGCAPKSSYLVWRPAQADVKGIERLVVLEFEGEADAANTVRQALVEKLRDGGFYTLVEPGELQRVAPISLSSSATSVPAAVDAARRLNIDGVLAGRVTRYSADSETAVKFADVALSFQLFDATSGDVRVTREATRQYRHLSAHRTPPSKSQALRDLTNGCVREVAEQVAPHQSRREVVLARQFYGRGVTALRHGNSLARQGDWPAAETAWELALKENHQNHAAMHNLALAAQARSDYTAAQKRIGQAIDEFGDTSYHAFRRQLEQDRHQFAQTMQQLESRQELVASRSRETSQIQPASFTQSPDELSSLPDLERLPPVAP